MVYHAWTLSLKSWICRKCCFALGVKGLRSVLKLTTMGQISISCNVLNRPNKQGCDSLIALPVQHALFPAVLKKRENTALGCYVACYNNASLAGSWYNIMLRCFHLYS